LRATVSPQRVLRVSRRLLRNGERTGTTLDIDATRIVVDKREAHITGKGEQGFKRTFVQRSIAGRGTRSFRSPIADPPASLDKPELLAIA
jgi:hypothetical protein